MNIVNIKKYLALLITITIVLVNLEQVNYSQAQDDENFDREAIIRLLEWRDPVGGELLNLPIDRTAPLDEQIEAVWNLSILDLSGTSLFGVPPEAIKDEEHLSELPSELFVLTNLNLLDLTDNQLTELPAEIGNLTNLEGLNLTNNQLTELPAEIGDLTNLRTLDLRFNFVEILPAEIGNLTLLHFLNLNKNELTELPSSIGNWTNLTYLELGSNYIEKLPPEVGNLINLEDFNLNGNDLIELPPQIGTMIHLESLNLSVNQLSSLPPEIGNLTALHHLDINGNELKYVPVELGQLRNLTYLNLSQNEIETLPPEIGNLIFLERLGLSGNQLTTLPREIGNLEQLTTLYLHANQISELPAEFWTLINLEKLWLMDNPLAELPPDVVNLVNLRELQLSDYQTTNLPVGLSQMPRLTILAVGQDGSRTVQAASIIDATLTPQDWIPVSTLPPPSTPVGTIVARGGREGCIHNTAWIAIPDDGMRVFEPLTIKGVADIDDFGFYRLELRQVGNGDTFTPLPIDYTESVPWASAQMGSLAEFDPKQFLEGEYRFRLVVFNTDANPVAKCEITIFISSNDT